MLKAIIDTILIPFTLIGSLLFPAPILPPPIDFQPILQTVSNLEKQIEKVEVDISQLQASVNDRVETIVGASQSAPSAVALFEDNLAARISDTATSFTLVDGKDIAGTALASSTYGFIIDEGTASEEMVLADCTSTACTNATRGLSPVTGTTTVTALRYEHRKGASVKITDAPALIYASNVFKGSQYIENILRYSTNPTFTADGQIITKKYVDDTAFSGAGVIDATDSARGVVEIATGAETASSTTNGSSGRLAIPASLATSTYNSGTAPLRVVVTQNSGKIDNSFIDLSTYADPATFSATTTVQGINVLNAFKNVNYISTTTSWIRPATTTVVYVEVLGGGGGGGAGGANDGGGSGGGASGYCTGFFGLGASSSISIIIGDGGSPTANGGVSTFGNVCTSQGGRAGVNSNGSFANQTDGGIGGTASSNLTDATSTLAVTGQTGRSGQGLDTANTGDNCISGAGGSAYIFGGGAPGVMAEGGLAGINATGYGSGGSGGCTTGSAGGRGSNGLVIIRW